MDSPAVKMNQGLFEHVLREFYLNCFIKKFNWYFFFFFVCGGRGCFSLSVVMLHLQTRIIYIYRCVMASPICFSNYWMYICIITAVNGIWTIYMLIYDPNSQNPSAVTMVTDWCNCTCQVSNHGSSCLCWPCFCVPAVTVMGVFRKQPRHWLRSLMVVLVRL